MTGNLQKFGTVLNLLSSNIARNPVTHCWNWERYKNSDGYGKIHWEGKNWSAHRLAYVAWMGPIPADKPHVLHSCDNPSCINPAHLWCGTHKENHLDKLAKGRQAKAKGEKNGRSKLANEQVLKIYHSNDSTTELANKYKVSTSIVRRIKAGTHQTIQSYLQAIGSSIS